MGFSLNVAGIVPESITDGPGIRFTLFVQGSPHNCEGCHNQIAIPFEGGTQMSTQEIFFNIKKNPLLSGVTFSGGDPFLQAECFAYIAERVRKVGLNIVTYTGFTFEELKRNNNIDVLRLLGLTDILIDGRFRIAEKDISLKFRGSRNQRVIDVGKSMRLGSPVLLYE
jgi:anaerobic ribonucleoside-triphosphate reductase activating protein